LASHCGKSVATFRLHDRTPPASTQRGFPFTRTGNTAFRLCGDQNMSFRPPNQLATLLALLPLALAAGCADPPEPEPGAEMPTPEPRTEAEPDPSEPSSRYERSLVFLHGHSDSALAAPWTFHTRRSSGGEIRERGVWLAREGSWELLAMEADTARSNSPPWRILPGESIRLVVGEGDRLRSLLFRDAARAMETSPGIVLAEWTGSSAEMVRFHRGSIVLPATSTEGFVLDLVRTWGSVPGDWIFLQGGDRFQALLVEEDPRSRAGGDRARSNYLAWTRMAVREARWPAVQVAWEDLRAFEPSRRDIPARWTLESGGHEIAGELESVGSLLSAGEGDGPILPLAGFFQVRGEIRMEGETFQVSGIIAHRQH